jgi:hypothetical protein
MAAGSIPSRLALLRSASGVKPKIDQDVACLVAAPRLGMHRKAEFADQRFARRLVAETPAKVLDVEVGQLSARGDSELITIDHYPNCHAVELGQ